ncbi:MAG: cytosine deaminase [Spirochaetales bacterium]|uniref:Cytosine deaminase n=1 Tax=Candidatus Thalassospirochaeta sargassi TaxID=3119039 RepID=A0AAJ1IDR9_9SPIO|nr:cytosine deaminase [Spirochaetales bacterium]
MDLLIKNAKLKEGGAYVDIAVENGVFQAVEQSIAGNGCKEIDAGGNLVVPPFIDPHVHLDAVLSVGDPQFNNTGTLLEGIRIWGERKKTLTKEVIVDNAVEAVKWEVANGVQQIRTHADTTDPTLTTVEALLEVKEAVKDIADVQIVAFPQDGIFTSKDGAPLMEKAMQMGVDVVGGIPHNEFTREDGVADVEFAFELAEKYDALIDIHVDETGDDQSRFVEVMAKLAIETGMGSRVTASHATSMHNFNNDYAFKLIGILKRSNMNVITNPFDNSVLQNRTDGYPRRRGHTRVDELDARGVNVSIGHDSIMDPWYPMGKGSMLQAANLLMHTAHMSGYDQIHRLFEMITDNTAVTMNTADKYGIEKGKPANFSILDTDTVFDALRLNSECLYVVREGRIISEAVPAKRKVIHDGYEHDIDFKLKK